MELYPPREGLTDDERSYLATRDHLASLVRKRDALVAAIDDCVAAFASQAARVEPSPAEMVEMWEFVRALKISGGTKTLLDQLRVSTTHMTAWRDDPPDPASRLSGRFPIGTQLLPKRGQPCVYLLLDDATTLLYVGCSESVRARLKTHWKTGRIPASRYHIITCYTRREALALEGDLIFQFQPHYNTADRKRRRFVA